MNYKPALIALLASYAAGVLPGAADIDPPWGYTSPSRPRAGPSQMGGGDMPNVPSQNSPRQRWTVN